MHQWPASSSSSGSKSASSSSGLDTRPRRLLLSRPRLARSTHRPAPCRGGRLWCTMTLSRGPLAQPTIHLEAKDGLRALEGISTLILDCDGVLWRGSEVIPGTREALAALRAAGKRLLFVTNNSSKSRRQYVCKFAALGIQAAPEEIVPTSYTAAAYLQSIGFSGRAFLVGGSGLEEELAAAGVDYFTLPQQQQAQQQQQQGAGDGGGGAAAAVPGWTVESFRELQLAAGVQAVVVGFDEHFSYEKLCYASACLREVPGCHFVATNLDNADNIGNGRMMPGTGCIVAAVETASSRHAFNVGKGGAWLLPFLCDKYGVQPTEACIVGDRLDTDIAMGKAAGGMKTILPLTGVTTMRDLEAADADSLPDYVVPSFGALLGF